MIRKSVQAVENADFCPKSPGIFSVEEKMEKRSVF
jgi:hypothetical protein